MPASFDKKATNFTSEQIIISFKVLTLIVDYISISFELTLQRATAA